MTFLCPSVIWCFGRLEWRLSAFYIPMSRRTLENVIETLAVWLFLFFFIVFVFLGFIGFYGMAWNGMGQQRRSNVCLVKKMFFLELVALIRHNLPRNNTNNNVASIKFMHACQTGLSNENLVSNVSHRNVFFGRCGCGVDILAVPSSWCHVHRPFSHLLHFD